MCGTGDNAALETMLGRGVELEHAFWVAEKASTNFRVKLPPCAAKLSLAMLLDTAE